MDQQENSPWQYKPDNGGPSPDSPEDDTASASPAPAPASHTISWQAAEFIEHSHPAGWYGLLVLSTALIAAATYLATKDFFATGTILLVGIIVGIFAGHKPRQVQYEISDSGLSINDKNYPYGSFKSFSVLREGPLTSANLFPLKRFMPPISIYFSPADEPKVVEALGNHLPYEEHKFDTIDRLSRRLRL
jgi:hypothetical protein